LCQWGWELKNYTRDIKHDLAEDAAKLRLIEEGKKLDLIEIGGFVAAFPVMLVSGARNLFVIDPTDAASLTGAGALIGLGVAFHKKISAASLGVAHSIAQTPREIKDSFMLFYVKESIKEQSFAAGSAFRTECKHPVPREEVFPASAKKDTEAVITSARSVRRDALGWC
jgi:hypothetical protein